MARTAAAVVADIAKFRPLNDDWRPLDRLILELHAIDAKSPPFADLLSVFERFPLEDGAGVLWGIVHWLEDVDGYEPHLLQSIRRVPSDLGVTMLGRMLNAHIATINGTLIKRVLQDVADDDDIAEEIRSSARNIITRHIGNKARDQ